MCYMAQFCANEETLSLFLESSKHSHPPWIIGIRSSACSFTSKLHFSVFFKNIYFCFIDYTKAFDCVDHNKLWKILKR